jgi:hypothetical protein
MYETPLIKRIYHDSNNVLLELLASKLKDQRVNPKEPLSSGFNNLEESSFSIEVMDNISAIAQIYKIYDPYREGFKNQLKCEKVFYPYWAIQNCQEIHIMDRFFCLEGILEERPSLDDNSKLRDALEKAKKNGNSTLEILRNNKSCYKKFLKEFGEGDKIQLVNFFNGDKLKITEYILRELEENTRNAFVFANVYWQIGQEKLVAAQYITWLNVDGKEDPLERMKRCSTVWINHLSYTLLPKVLKDVETVFCRSLQCQELETLIPLVGEFRFKFAFACPYERGSAAIAEWFEKAIYQSKDYELSYKNGVMIDLKAFETPSLPLFLKKYPSYIVLKNSSPC